MDDKPVINRPVFERLRELVGGPEMLGTLVETFRSESAGILETIRGGLDAGTLEPVAAAAHRLKSSSGLFGLDPLTRTCIALEKAARAGNADEARTHADLLAALFPAATAALDEPSPA